jgi:hypothetical protein
MTNGLTEYPHIEPTKLVAVEAALLRINPKCYVGLYSEIIRKELERALYDQLSDEQNTLRYLWGGELRKLNNFLKRLQGQPPTPERLRLRISELHEVTKHFLNARLKISGNSKIGLAELNLGSPNDLDELKKAIYHTRAVHREKPGGGHHRSLHDVTNAVRRVYTQASGKKPTLTSDTSAARLPRQMNFYEELLLESIKVIKPHMTLNGARELDRAATGQRLKALK